MGGWEGRPIWAQGVGVSGGKWVELPGWAVTSEPLAQLSPDVSPSFRPRLSWSSNDAPHSSLRPQRDLESSRRDSSAWTHRDETGVCERVWGCGHSEARCHVCVHVCGGTACSQNFVCELRCVTATFCVGQWPCEAECAGPVYMWVDISPICM